MNWILNLLAPWDLPVKLFFDQYWKVCGIGWCSMWSAYWLGLVLFHTSKEKPEIYAPWYGVLGTFLLILLNTLWFLGKGYLIATQ